MALTKVLEVFAKVLVNLTSFVRFGKGFACLSKGLGDISKGFVIFEKVLGDLGVLLFLESVGVFFEKSLGDLNIGFDVFGKDCCFFEKN